jgi:hypothetical protein
MDTHRDSSYERDTEGATLDDLSARHHDAFMRTTLTLDPDVVRMLKDEVHSQRKPFKQVVNEALRRGLSPRAPGPASARYCVRPHKTTLQPGIDAGAFNKLVDELEDEAVVARMRATAISADSKAFAG